MSQTNQRRFHLCDDLQVQRQNSCLCTAGGRGRGAGGGDGLPAERRRRSLKPRGRGGGGGRGGDLSSPPVCLSCPSSSSEHPALHQPERPTGKTTIQRPTQEHLSYLSYLSYLSSYITNTCVCSGEAARCLWKCRQRENLPDLRHLRTGDVLLIYH